MEGRIWMWPVCVCLSPALSGSAIHLHIPRVDSPRLNVSLDITTQADIRKGRARVEEGQMASKQQRSYKIS